MPDRLRDLIDLVVASLDEAGTDGRALAGRAHFSRDHLDRLLAAATGESPVALRRRLLLERAAWQLRRGTSAAEAAHAAGYGSASAFSRAFARAYGTPPRAWLRGDGAHELPAPNGIHFHPPGALLVGGPVGPRRDLADRMVAFHVDRTRELLEAAQRLDADALQRRARPGLVVTWFEGPEETAALMAERLVFTLEVWVAAIAGHPVPEDAGPLLPRLDRAGPAFARLVRSIDERGAWDHAFVDALCEPPQSFTYGGVVSHVLNFGAVRRETLAAVLRELGASISDGEPILWEQARL